MILVTCATDNVGRAAVDWLVSRDHEVRAAVGEAAPGAWNGRAETVRFDWSDRSTWDPALDGADSLVLVHPSATADASSALCEFSSLAMRRGCRRVAFLSVLGAGTKRWAPHRKVEDHLRRTETSWTFLRVGPSMQDLVDARLDEIRDGELMSPARRAKVAWVDARDVGEAAARSLLDGIWEQRIPVLTGPEAMDLEEICQELSVFVGRGIRCRRCSAVGCFLRLRFGRGLPIAQCLARAAAHRRFGASEASEVRDDLRLLLGRAPRALGDFLRDRREILSRI